MGDVLAQLAGGPGVSVVSQDDPTFPDEVRDVTDDTALERSWRHDVETVPTLLRVEEGEETGEGTRLGIPYRKGGVLPGHGHADGQTQE